MVFPSLKAWKKKLVVLHAAYLEMSLSHRVLKKGLLMQSLLQSRYRTRLAVWQMRSPAAELPVAVSGLARGTCGAWQAVKSHPCEARWLVAI